MNILDIQNLSVEYFRDSSALRALRDVSIHFEAGETTAIVGESGCGKSTLALSILGLIFPYEGRIVSGTVNFKKKNVLANSLSEWMDLRGREISIVFQDPFSSLNPVLTIRRQIYEVIKTHEPEITETAINDRIRFSLEEVMLKDQDRILSSYPHQLSGGQRQRIVIAMAIANRPQVLIADEPTTSLDVTVQKDIMDLIDKLKEDLSLTVILITHNLPLARQRAQKVAVMYAGKIIEYGAASELFTRPLHPYTQGLLKSIPQMNKPPAKQFVLEGQPPDMSELPPGCKFHPRCGFVMDVCRGNEPPLYEKNNSLVRCYLMKEVHKL
jgi:oligopeptide/dipeptide ABC transporter ATP-binding protein